MTRLSERIALLDGLSTDAATQALIDALNTALPEERGELALALLQRPTRAGNAALVRHYHDFPDYVSAEIAKSGENFSSSLIRALASDRKQTRLNALDLVIQRADLFAVESLPSVLERREPDEQSLAGEGLLAITRRHVGHGALRPPTHHLDRIDAAIARAVDTYPNHRLTAPLLAAAILSVSPGPRLKAWFDDLGHPAHFAFRGVLKRLDLTERTPHLLAWLAVEAVAPQVLELLEQDARQPDLLPVVLEQAHVILLPAVQQRLARLNARRPAVIDRGHVEELNEATQERLPMWLTAIPLTDQDRAQRLGDAAAFREPLARLAALRRLMELPDDAAAECIATFAFDRDERIARLATHESLDRCIVSIPDLIDRLRRSPHESVRRLADDRHVGVEFEWVWRRWIVEASKWDETPTPSTLAAARALLERERGGFLDEIRRRFRAGGRDTLLLAIRITETLDLAPEVELELLMLTRGKDMHVIASAMKALGTLNTNSARQAVVAGLHFAEDRVGANAIDALTESELFDQRDYIESLATAGHNNRVRANAVRALARIDRSGSMKRLSVMLLDRRPMHRISALWVAERLNAMEVARNVARLAQEDPRPVLRRRAARVARRLLALMESRAALTKGSHEPEETTTQETGGVVDEH